MKTIKEDQNQRKSLQQHLIDIKQACKNIPSFNDYNFKLKNNDIEVTTNDIYTRIFLKELSVYCDDNKGLSFYIHKNKIFITQ